MYVTNTLTIRTKNAGYARYTLNTLAVRYSYVIRTRFIRMLTSVVYSSGFKPGRLCVFVFFLKFE